MQIAKSKTATIAIAMLLALLIAASTLLPNTIGQVSLPPGTKVPTYTYLNVGPNPIGVGQRATLNMFMAIPLITSESAVNMTIVQKDPDGITKTLGPFKSDATGGTYTTMVPDKVGNWTFQFFYGGQNLTGSMSQVVMLPSHSDVETLVVQEEPIVRTAWPLTPLPTQWWQTPVTAENVQEWYKIAGPWLGYGSVTFAQTGGYNATGNYNPYTESVLAGHVLWTKIWAEGGVSGLSGNEESGHYWSTSQYWPKYAPVIINGIMYSDWKVESNSYKNGILAVDLYTGETLWNLNTSSSLRCGMVTQWHTINAYGAIGPYIWTTGGLPAAETGGRLIGTPSSFSFAGYTPGVLSSFMNTTGTQWNMYSALTGQYVLSVVNGTDAVFTTDENGNMLGYYINSTTGTMNTYGPAPTFGSNPLTGQVNVSRSAPVLCCFNMSQALGNSWGWGPSQNTIIDFGLGVMWAVPVWNNISGVPINPALAINGMTGDAVVMTGGFEFGQYYGGQQCGWLVVGAQDAKDGHQLWVKNFTEADTDTLAAFTRTEMLIHNGLWINVNLANSNVIAINARTGTTAWTRSLRKPDGSMANKYNIFGLRTYSGPGVVFFEGFGGDIWCLNVTNGNVVWYTNTEELVGESGIETPYDIWPLWVFSCSCITNDVAYFAVGHEYNPPLFHGAQLLAINITDGTLIWSELDMSIESTAIAYGILLSRNAYDNQIYAFGKGPSAVTVTAPNIGVTTETPITITGTVMDVSPGTRAIVQPDETKTKQNEIALRFPNGVPCVSDESQSKWMEHVYQQQPLPANVTGVPISIDVLDSNNNYYNIGTATSDSSGSFGFTWTPTIPGDFKVIATYAGSNSYYGSCAVTYFYASEAPQPTPAPTPTPAPMTDTYVMGFGIGMIIAIIVVGLLLFMMLRKR